MRVFMLPDSDLLALHRAEPAKRPAILPEHGGHRHHRRPPLVHRDRAQLVRESAHSPTQTAREQQYRKKRPSALHRISTFLSNRLSFVRLDTNL